MKRLALPIALALSCASALVVIPCMDVMAQGTSGGVDARTPNTRAARNAAKAQKNPKVVENAFPNATRAEPDSKLPSKLQKKVQKALDALYDEKYDIAEAGFKEIIGDAQAGNYAHALAYQGLANIAVDRDDDTAKTLEYNKKAIDLDALPNASHFGALLQYANLNMIEEHYEEAIKTIDQWLKLSGTEKDAAYAIKAQSLYRLERLDEAAVTIKKAITISEKPSEGWNQLLLASYYENEKFAEAIAEGEAMLAKQPDSKTLTRTLGNIYVQADQPDKAVALLSAAYQKGMMSTEAEVKQLYQLYNFGDRSLEAIKVIEEGFAKGVLPKNLEHLRALGDSYRLSDKPVEASAAFAEAAKFASDGEMSYMQAYTLYEAEKNAEAKVAVEAALKRTPFKSEGNAWILLGNCELELNNKAAAIAAYKKAAGFEQSRKLAENWLKNAARM